MTISPDHIRRVLQDERPATLEALAREAKELTERQFGRTIALYAPLYLSNFCSSHCTYCGFHSKNRITRFKLTPEQMHREMAFLARQGIENVLLLTGESYKVTPLSYLKEAVGVARDYFPSIALEVHPMDEEDYRALFEAGADGITVYQETYDRQRYTEVHLSGIKADYNFRYRAPARAAAAGMRTIAMGILLGLADITEDLCALYSHLRAMEKTYPGVEYSLSFPRLQPIKDVDFIRANVDDATFVKIICLTRILFPRVGINLSTRETPALRDRILEFGITRMSAGSNTAVGGYTLIDRDRQDPQFDIEDGRGVDDVVAMLKARNFDPVFTDWRRIQNEPAR
ncbi:MAG: 2-iminoacetate synthase ThiH [Candidatus Omnitrophica bacterium]|nr:2-iminoacetate synthase ThiH [Candidatus Omnitrophota bacterium]